MPFHRRLAFRFTALTVSLVMLTIGYFAVRTYSRDREALQERFGLALERIVATAALQIDGDAHRTIKRPEDSGSPAFLVIRDHLRRVQAVNYLAEDLLYTFHILDEKTMRAAVMLQEVPYTGDIYHVVPANVSTLRRVIETKQAAHTRLYEDAHGIWVSAYAPILDANGEVAGILEADYDLNMFSAALNKELTRLVGLSLSAVGLALLLSLLYGRRLEVALQAIREGARAIEDERYEHRIRVLSNDELGLVANQFNHTAEVLFERFHLLKFLPKHALDGVKRRIKGGKWEDVERVDASILFSDIRGYTAMSSGLSDERIVAMLNTYLKSQAEIIEEHGGTIDKFIGDAVLAVFTGPAHESRAVQSAQAIQRAVIEMNARQSFEREVRLGIGIASGSVVFGEVGSEGRRERTILGSIVNLASRLCSHAGADEVVVSEPVRRAVGDSLVVARTEEVELKGFPGLQRCHTLGA